MRRLYFWGGDRDPAPHLGELVVPGSFEFEDFVEDWLARFAAGARRDVCDAEG